ncbi:MAG: hypothetical protein MUF42_14090 [Cytophagaceae bacterium]|jgi:hypothetical protein|nr:hypothetical protein [Cytophagaceae bacterium]
MQYLMTGIELHPDKGFGITADSYYKSAEHLMTNRFEHYDVTQQAEMPQNFLYRHAIELYLKSLIIIFHRKLKINYGNEPFDSEEPEIFNDGKWRKLYTCHFIDKLYEYWLNNLLLPNIDVLNEKAPKGDWQETKKITYLFPVISKYDQDSSYFRYPITKNSSLDTKKYTMQKFKTTNMDQFIKEIQEQISEAKKGTFTMLLIDDSDNIVEAFKQTEDVLSDVRDALKEVAFYFSCIHIMTRITLCGGM